MTSFMSLYPVLSRPLSSLLYTCKSHAERYYLPIYYTDKDCPRVSDIHPHPPMTAQLLSSFTELHRSIDRYKSYCSGHYFFDHLGVYSTQDWTFHFFSFLCLYYIWRWPCTFSPACVLARHLASEGWIGGRSEGGYDLFQGSVSWGPGRRSFHGSTVCIYGMDVMGDRYRYNICGVYSIHQVILKKKRDCSTRSR
jgi:hypothetical protein